MSFSTLYDFLRDLEKHNSKDWMDENRKRYHENRDWFASWIEELSGKLQKIDKNFTQKPGKKALNRINNNLMYHPNKPTYKNHFGAGLDNPNKSGDFYIHIGTTESFLGGGYWHPGTKVLKSVRDAIDYNGDEFQKILNKKSFKDMFGGLIDDDPLKTSPKGYSSDHKHIELLNHKSFAVTHPVTQKEVMKDDFQDKVIAVYQEILPFRRYLNKAVTV
ncbi:hypothetical protein LCGC14_0992050 [marine sediment metagenome]|uniref:DUF2461 domain-containing protein n=2 Tax=root TaxID=1 RepID=A0A831QJI7_9FLAO|nr:DUF2461 domain-containing protein [Pricia sp.]HEA19460.1 DUF2461 domain-containing protein [Pricia antarctica]